MPIIHVRSEAEYETVLDKAVDKLVVVDFTATWCGPCQKVAPAYEEMSNKYRHTMFLKVDVDENQEIAMQNNVQAMPTFIFLRQKKELARIRGADVQGLEDKIKELGGPPGAATFVGTGNRLGGEDSSPSNSVQQSSPKTSTTTAVPASVVEIAQNAMGVDNQKPVTKINVRLSDGSRFTVTLNLAQPVSALREFICAVRPDQSSKCFALMTTFPSKELNNEEMSIQDANLANAVVVQKMK